MKGQNDTNTSTKIELNKVLLVIAIIIGLIGGFCLLFFNT